RMSMILQSGKDHASFGLSVHLMWLEIVLFDNWMRTEEFVCKSINAAIQDIHEE
ncbi:unnamed protein product, partial [Dovyalis caffra]